MKFLRKMKKGFTIVELVIVIAVIAVLTAILVPTFINISKKANQASDQSFKNYLNKALALVENDPELNKNGENVTMHYAIEDLEAYGISLNKIVTKSDEKLVWKLSENKFYFESEIKTDADRLGCWKIQNSIQEGQKFSVYAGEGYTGNSATVVSVGFDAGYKTNITTVNYSNDIPGRKVVIRTNSEATTLTIDDSSTGTIYHYGSTGALNVIKCHTASYHENGKVGFAEIAKGRIVLESGADVEEIHINKKTDSSFDTVIITNNAGEEELPDRITRDAVTVTDETLVVTVESNGSSENVYVYADSDTGTKGSTEQTSTQNTGVNSALGQLVLDNGSTGDKAQTAEEKADAKDAAASEAVSADFEQDPANANYVARIGQTGYLTLDAAINSATASENPVTISVLKDVQQSGSLLIRNSVSINGGNHIITTVGTATSGNMAAFDICDTEQNSPIIVNVKDLTINSTKHSRVFLLNADYCSYDNTNILNVNNLIITTDGQALYSNGPSTINARNCEIRHEGQYLSGKDAVYYSALIVGYNGTLNVYDSKVSSFGNGAATFPSGGTINIYNTEITAFDDFVDASTGYLFWARHEKSYDTGDYKDWCGSAIINVYSGVFEGPYRITHDGLTSANRIAAINIYGGTFEQNPSEYVQDGHSAQQNQDGTWTVK